MSSTPALRATFRDVLAVGEFRALWASQLLSELGDRLTLVALTLLIYNRTGSPLLSALTYAAGSLPWVAGTLIFSGLGDRTPRRGIMVACDVIRALMVAVMLLPGMPITVLVSLLYLTIMAQAPFEAARSAVLPDVLRDERYALAATVMQTSFRIALVAGAAVGGVAVAFLGARPALGLDAATFIASAALIRFGTRGRLAGGEMNAAQARIAPSAALVLGMTARLLPEADRARYTEEWLGELWDLAAAGACRWGQLVHMAQVLAQARVMRAVLRTPDR